MTKTATKVVELEALADLVSDGSTVAVGGAWFSNHPMAAVRQLIRIGSHGLRVVSLLGSLDIDLLIAAGTIDELTFSMVTLEAFGLAPAFRRSGEQGTIRMREVTALALNTAIEAAARNQTFLPFHGPEGSDIVTMHPDFYGHVNCPFTGQRTMAIRALKPDVALIHATRADCDGNAQLNGTFGIDDELARAASHVVVTCEEVVSRSTIEASSQTTAIPGFLVDAVIEAPFGAHPMSHVPRYALDALEVLRYSRLAGDEVALRAEIATISSESEAEYRARVLDTHRQGVLRQLVKQGKIVDADSPDHG